MTQCDWQPLLYDTGKKYDTSARMAKYITARFRHFAILTEMASFFDKYTFMFECIVYNAHPESVHKPSIWAVKD